ncbi:MAG: hypothetical protein COW01_14905 [Bdellovibrionales bacterium CG12_big_fil_rev_8_21_14_0_65_38_15]|nr:MAG: hypothetical protein COW79_06310 [Bdellovibrionales bacterium CG22_combo_CG10-13_8_21_14_all_38_13]PIQ52834.1 MAG: hypothetical protein COW01_14905 [Bdellovibrionales bacterium CG12_big_fil_rev_8_21_14_0_65_38_15]PIR29721.1 MAG: hypothetical protein COV38_09240 [Bdellovibrionales bacterium CG11_big_fil_rev_8_21_14_0_20_38_13]
MFKLSLKFFLFLFIFASTQLVLADETEALMKQMERDRIELEKATQDAQEKLLNLADPTSSDSTTQKTIVFNIDEILAPYRSESPETTKEHLRKKLDGKPIVSTPKFIDFLDDLMRDEQALQKAANIINDKKKLAAFFVFNLLLFFIGFIFKKLHRAKNLESGAMMRMVRFFWRLSFMSAIRVGVIIYFFGANLSPTWDIVKKNFF